MPTGGMAWNDSECSSDEEEALEVLPPAKLNKHEGEDRNSTSKPQLSFTGKSAEDPLSLSSSPEDNVDEDDNTSDESTCNIRSGEKIPSKQKKVSSTQTNRIAPTSKPTIAKTNGFSSSSEDDDDDCFAEYQRITFPVRKRVADTSSTTSNKKVCPARGEKQKDRASDDRRMEQQKKKEEKAREKQAAKERRERERDERQQAKEVAKQQRQKAKQACEQASGKLAHAEIAVLWNIPIAADEEFVKNFRVEENSAMGRWRSSVEHCVQWIRRDGLEGGAEAALQALRRSDTTGYQNIPVVAVVVSGDSFLQLLQHDGEDDYPRLESWIQNLHQEWRSTWKTEQQEPRIILLLNGVQEELEKRWKRSKSNKTMTTLEELQDALTWLLIEFRVESMRCRDEEDLLRHVAKITRLLAEAPYVQDTTEIACVKKIHCEVAADATDDERAQDCWLRQVQQVPRVSQRMAATLVQYYPTGVSLWRDYMNPEVAEGTKKLLLADMFVEGRQCRKLSTQFYTLMTTDDPNHVI